MRKFECRCCGKVPDCPIINDTLWISINGGNMRGFLCISCAETRLGRNIELNDLKRCVGNEFFFLWAERNGQAT